MKLVAMASAGARAAAKPRVMTEPAFASTAVCTQEDSSCHHIYLRERQQYITKCPSSSFLPCTLSPPRSTEPQTAFLGDVLVSEDEQHCLVESFLDFTRSVRGTQLHLLREETNSSDLQFVCTQNSGLIVASPESPWALSEEEATAGGTAADGSAAGGDREERDMAPPLLLGFAAAGRGHAAAKQLRQQRQRCGSNCSLPTLVFPPKLAPAAEAGGPCLRLYRIIDGGLLFPASSSCIGGGEGGDTAAAPGDHKERSQVAGEQIPQTPAAVSACTAAAGITRGDGRSSDPKSAAIAAAAAKADCAAAASASSGWRGQLDALLEHVQQQLQQQVSEQQGDASNSSSGRANQSKNACGGGSGGAQQKSASEQTRTEGDAAAARAECITHKRLLVAAPLLPLALDSTRVLLLEGLLRRCCRPLESKDERESIHKQDGSSSAVWDRPGGGDAAVEKRDMPGGDAYWTDSSAAAAATATGRRQAAAADEGSKAFSERRGSSNNTHELLHTTGNTNTDESSSTRSDSSSAYWPEAEALTDLLHEHLYGGVWSCTVEAGTEEEETQNAFPLLLSSARIDASVMVLAADGEDQRGPYRRISFFFHFRRAEDLICAVGSAEWGDLAQALASVFGSSSMTVRIYKGIAHSRREEAAALHTKKLARSSSPLPSNSSSGTHTTGSSSIHAGDSSRSSIHIGCSSSVRLMKTNRDRVATEQVAGAHETAKPQLLRGERGSCGRVAAAAAAREKEEEAPVSAAAAAAAVPAEVLAALREKHAPRRLQQQQQLGRMQQQQENREGKQSSGETQAPERLQQQQEKEEVARELRVVQQQQESNVETMTAAATAAAVRSSASSSPFSSSISSAAAAAMLEEAAGEIAENSSSSKVTREAGIFDSRPLLQDDPKFAAVAEQLDRRLALLQHATAAIEEIFGSISSFAAGHKVFGFHRVEAPPGGRPEEGGWIYREWLPHAEEVFLFGDFNNWDRASHPLRREPRAIAPHFFEAELQLQEAIAAAATLSFPSSSSSNSSNSSSSEAAYAALVLALQQQQKQKKQQEQQQDNDALSSGEGDGGSSSNSSSNSSSKREETQPSGVWSIFLPDRPDGSWQLQHKSRVRIRVITAAEGEQREVDRVPAWMRVVWREEDSKLFNGVLWAPPFSERYEFRHQSPRLRLAAAAAAAKNAEPLACSSSNGGGAEARGVSPAAAAAAAPAPKIYEVHVGSSGGTAESVGSYKEVKEQLLPRIVRLGYNAILLNGVVEHADYASFGFFVTNFFAISSRFGTVEEFKALVDAAHAADMHVLLCIYHSHASSNALEGLGCIDGCSSTYFSTQQQREWGAEAKLFDFTNVEVLRFLLSNLSFFLQEYRIDGFRFEGVSSMLYDHHGTGRSFDGADYANYFSSPSLNISAVLYLSLANMLLQHLLCQPFPHQYHPHIIPPPPLSIANEWTGFPSLCRPWQHGGMGFCMRYTSQWGQQVRQQLQQYVSRCCLTSFDSAFSSSASSSSSSSDGLPSPAAASPGGEEKKKEDRKGEGGEAEGRGEEGRGGGGGIVPLAGMWNLSELVWGAAAQPNTEKVLRALEDADSTRTCQRPLLVALFSWESLHTHAVGGVAPHVTELAAALARLGCEVHVFVRATGVHACRKEYYGVIYHECCFSLNSDFVLEMRNMCDSFLHCMQQVEAEKGEPFQVCHAHDWLAARAMIAAKIHLGRVCIFTMHSTEFGRCGNNAYGGISKSIRDIEAEACHVADRVICVSGVLAAEVQQQYGIHPAKIKVIYNGIQCHKFDGEVDGGSVKAHYGIGALQPMFLFVGRLAVQKGPDLLLEAVPYVLRFRGDARFVFVGDGHMMPQLKQRAKHLNVEHAVQFVGQTGGAALHALFKSCDAVVVPSRNEPFGIVVLEAWSSSKPVVATNSGGPRDFVNPDHTGYLVDPSPGSIAWGCCEILKNFEHSRWMGSRGRVTAAFSFSWDSIASQTREIYYQQHCLHDVPPNCSAARRGDCTLAFSLLGTAMYCHMSLADEEPRVLQGLALWRALKLLLLPLSTGMWCFMGNEFAHPDGIDLPRPGNNFSLASNFRRWSLSDDISLKFHICELFEACLSHWEDVLQCQSSSHLYVVRCSDEEQVVIIERGNCLFAINLHPIKSYAGYQAGCNFSSPLRLLLDSDERRFGGFGRLTPRSQHPLLEPRDGRRYSVKLYLPSRTAALYAPEAFLEEISEKLAKKEVLQYSPQQYVTSLSEIKRRLGAAAATAAE